MEWGIVITGMYLMGMVMLAISSVNADSTSQAQSTEQSQTTTNQDSMKHAA